MSDFTHWLLKTLDMSTERFIRLALRWLVVLSAALFVLEGLTATKTGAAGDIFWALLMAAICFGSICALMVVAEGRGQ